MSHQIILKNNEPGQVVSGSKAQLQFLVRRCCDVLQRSYPHRIWHVMAPDYSVIAIRALDVDRHYGVILHVNQIQDDPRLMAVVRAGGEILERAFIARTASANSEQQLATQLDLQGAARVRLNDQGKALKKAYQ